MFISSMFEAYLDVKASNDTPVGDLHSSIYKDMSRHGDNPPFIFYLETLE